MAIIDFSSIVDALQAGRRADSSINRGPLEIGLSREQGGPSGSDYNISDYAKSIAVKAAAQGPKNGFLWGHSLWGSSTDKVV